MTCEVCGKSAWTSVQCMDFSAAVPKGFSDFEKHHYCRECLEERHPGYAALVEEVQP